MRNRRLVCSLTSRDNNTKLLVYQGKHIFVVVSNGWAILWSGSISVRVNLFRFRREEAEYIALDSRSCSWKWRVSIGAIAWEGKPFGFTSAGMAYVYTIFQLEIFLCSRGRKILDDGNDKNGRWLMHISLELLRTILEVLRFIDVFFNASMRWSRAFDISNYLPSLLFPFPFPFFKPFIDIARVISIEPSLNFAWKRSHRLIIIYYHTISTLTVLIKIM